MVCHIRLVKIFNDTVKQGDLIILCTAGVWCLMYTLIGTTMAPPLSLTSTSMRAADCRGRWRPGPYTINYKACLEVVAFGGPLAGLIKR